MPQPLPTLYGANDSVYVRAARLALLEKGVEHERVPVDIFGAATPDWYDRIHPFKRIPAFEHDGFWLYETVAIMRYIDEAFVGPPLMPTDARGRARVSQIDSVIDAYLYRPLIWDIYVERCEVGTASGAPDEGKIESAVALVKTCFAALEVLMVPSGPYLLGAQLTLADLHLVPMIALGRRAAEGLALLEHRPQLRSWWQTMSARPSVTMTAIEPEA